MPNELSTIKSIAQARAKFAWECANGKDKEYGSLVSKIPTYIKTNGLLNTLAFLFSKSKRDNREEQLLKQICNWILVPLYWSSTLLHLKHRRGPNCNLVAL